MRHELIQNFYDSPEYLEKLRERVRNLKKMTEDEYFRTEKILDTYSIDPVQWIEDFAFIKFTEFGGSPKPFFLFEYQKKIIRELQEKELSNQDIDLLVDKPRGMGLTWLITAYFTWRWLYTPNYSAFILSRTEKEVDDGTSVPDNSIFGKIRWQMNMLPKWMIPTGFKPKTTRGTSTDSSLRIINPTIDSSLIGSSTNANAGRSRRYSTIFVDECFFIDHFQEVYRALTSVARLKIFVSTTVESKVAKDFKNMCEERGSYLPLTWRDHPFKDDLWFEQLQEKALQLDDPDLMREAEISYSVSAKNQYYPQITESTVEPLVYQRNRPIYVSLDIGRQDLTVLGYWQFNGMYFDLIEAYENKNKPLTWYVPFMNPHASYDDRLYSDFQLKFIKKITEWKKPIAYFGEQDHLNKRMPTNQSDADVLRPFGINIRANQYAINHPPRHAATTIMLPKMRFNQDSASVMKIYDAVANSKYASMSRATTENLKPVHGTDGTADRRSMVENFCVNVGRLLKNQRHDVRDLETRSFASAIIKQLRV